MLPLLPFNSYKLLRPAGSYELQVGLLFTVYCLLFTDLSPLLLFIQSSSVCAQ